MNSINNNKNSVLGLDYNSDFLRLNNINCVIGLDNNSNVIRLNNNNKDNNKDTNIKPRNTGMKRKLNFDDKDKDTIINKPRKKRKDAGIKRGPMMSLFYAKFNKMDIKS